MSYLWHLAERSLLLSKRLQLIQDPAFPTLEAVQILHHTQNTSQKRKNIASIQLHGLQQTRQVFTGCLFTEKQRLKSTVPKRKVATCKNNIPLRLSLEGKLCACQQDVRHTEPGPRTRTRSAARVACLTHPAIKTDVRYSDLLFSYAP